MDAGETSLPGTINPNNFPAKLWRLVNNPANKSIYWDSLGELVIIDQQLFEKQVLSPGSITPDPVDGFKTTNFSSFIRQLNLYGFKKADPANKDSRHCSRDNRACHQFYNPNFKRSHPELVANLMRLTVDNKAKLQAGLSMTCRPPTQHQRSAGGGRSGDRNVERGNYVSANSSSLLSPKHQESTHPYYLNTYQDMTAHNGTPVPPRYLMRGHSASPSPSVFATDKGIPVSLKQQYPGVASSSSAVHVPQCLLASANHRNPNFTSFNAHNAQYQPGYYSQLCHYYHPNLVASHITGSGFQAGLFSPQSYYQPGYPVTMWCHGEHNQGSQNKENQEEKKCDVNLDTVFQIADEVMQTPPNNCLVSVVTPEKSGPVLDLSPATCKATLCDSPASTTKAKPLCAIPIITAVSGNVSPVTCRQQEESVVSVPEQMPEDAISECPGKVSSDEAKDNEVIFVKVCDTHMDPSQA